MCGYAGQPSVAGFLFEWHVRRGNAGGGVFVVCLPWSFDHRYLIISRPHLVPSRYEKWRWRGWGVEGWPNKLLSRFQKLRTHLHAPFIPCLPLPPTALFSRLPSLLAFAPFQLPTAGGNGGVP